MTIIIHLYIYLYIRPPDKSVIGSDKQNFERKIVNIFKLISFKF